MLALAIANFIGTGKNGSRVNEAAAIENCHFFVSKLPFPARVILPSPSVKKVFRKRTILSRKMISPNPERAIAKGLFGLGTLISAAGNRQFKDASGLSAVPRILAAVFILPIASSGGKLYGEAIAFIGKSAPKSNAN